MKSLSRSAVNIRIIRNEEEFHSLRNAWNELLRNSYSDNVFLTWECAFSWWEVFNKNKELFIIVAEDAGKIVGIAPFYLTKTIFFGLTSLKHLEFIGSVGYCPEYLDFIILKGMEQEVLCLFFDMLFCNSQADWDVMNLISVYERSNSLIWMRKFLRENMVSHLFYNQHVSPFIELPPLLDDYLKTLGYEIKYKKRKLLKTHPVTFELAQQGNDLDSDFTKLISLHQRRWNKKNEPGSFDENRVNYLTFHKKIIKRFNENNWLYLAFLKHNNETIASQYNFIYGGKIYCFSVGFDPAWSKHSVGSVLMLMVIEDAIQKKVKEFDFLSGEEEYKYRWTDKKRVTFDLAIFRSRKKYHQVKLEKIARQLCRAAIPKTIAKKLYSRLFQRKN